MITASVLASCALTGCLSDACEEKYGEGWYEVTDRAVLSCEYGGLVRKSHPKYVF